MSPSSSRAPHPVGHRPRAIVPVAFAVLVVGGVLAGCAATAPVPSPAGGSATTASPAARPVVPMGDMRLPTADEIATTWAARPAYVTALPADWQAAYQFALTRPDVLQWLPCYCGCGGMGHRSNLDCFFQRREAPGAFTWEEHASYCDICVKTANMAASMIEDGRPISEIRAAVDAAFGNGAAPGTDTPLPPAA